VSPHKDERGVGNRAPKPVDPSKPSSPIDRDIGIGPLYKKQLLAGSAFTSQEGDDKTYVAGLETKISAEALSASYNAEKLKAKAVAVKFSAKVNVVHGQVDLVQSLKDLIFGEEPQLQPNPASPPAPMAARVGDLTVHGSPLVPGPGSPDVLIGGMPAWRIGIDLHLCPFPGPPHGAGPTTLGATTVLINGFAAARAGDFVVEPTGGPDVILLGCPTVLIGPQAPPPPPPKPVEKEPEDLPWVKLESVATGDAGQVSLDAQLGGELDASKGKGKVEVQAGAMVAALKAELPLKVRIRIPFTTYYLGLGVKAEGTLLSAGAEAGAGFAINEKEGKRFSATAGAKAGVGLGGAGIKFSLDVAQ
jgi:uncharacterized Zn-binding protein involved in type VI secretion